jgi:hypothetical protein
VGRFHEEITVYAAAAQREKGAWPAAEFCRGMGAALLGQITEGATYQAPTYSFLCGDPDTTDHNLVNRTHVYDVQYLGSEALRYIRVMYTHDGPTFSTGARDELEWPAMVEGTKTDGPELKAFRLMMGTLHPTSRAAAPRSSGVQPSTQESAAKQPGDGAVPLLR